jgi:RNA polymerase sigma-70 factor (ECF subfamily)
VPLPDDGESGPVLVSGGPDPEQTAISAGEEHKLEAVLASLPDEFREVLVLRELEECSYKEIADITGAPIGTVMSRLSRARLLLKEKWRGLP